MQQGLPSPRNIQRAIYSQYKSLGEGVFGFDDLVTHIDQGS